MKTTVILAAIAMFLLAETYAATPVNPVKPDSNATFQAAINMYPKDVVEFRVMKASDDDVLIKIFSNDGIKVYQRKLKRANVVEIDCDISHLNKGTYRCVVEKNGHIALEKVITKKTEVN